MQRSDSTSAVEAISVLPCSALLPHPQACSWRGSQCQPALHRCVPAPPARAAQALKLYEHLEWHQDSVQLCYPQIAACHKALGNLPRAETQYQQIWEGERTLAPCRLSALFTQPCVHTWPMAPSLPFCAPPMDGKWCEPAQTALTAASHACADKGMKPSARFSAASALAGMWLERGELDLAAQLLRDIEPLLPQDSRPTSLAYVRLLQRAGCQVCRTALSSLEASPRAGRQCPVMLQARPPVAWLRSWRAGGAHEPAAGARSVCRRSTPG